MQHPETPLEKRKLLGQWASNPLGINGDDELLATVRHYHNMEILERHGWVDADVESKRRIEKLAEVYVNLTMENFKYHLPAYKEIFKEFKE